MEAQHEATLDKLAQQRQELTKSEEIAGAITVTDRGISISNIDDLYRFAQMVHQSELAPEAFKTPQAIMVAVEMGLELGIKPMASLRTIAVINGRPCLWGDGMLGIVRASGLLEWIEETIEGEGDGMVATCATKRRGDPKPCERTFSASNAKTAGLWAGANSRSPNLSPWFKYPDRMLKMRARAFCLRDNFSDVLAGCITAEEAQDIDAERQAFDPDQAQGDKAESLAKALKPGSEVVAEQRSDPTITTSQANTGSTDATNSDDGKIESSQEDTSAALVQEQAKSSSSNEPTENPTPTTDESTSSAGPDSSTKDTGAKPADGDVVVHEMRYLDLCSLAMHKAEVSTSVASKLTDAWLKKRKHPDIADLADDGLWQIIYKAAQRQDWEKFKADNLKLLGD